MNRHEHFFLPCFGEKEENADQQKNAIPPHLVLLRVLFLRKKLDKFQFSAIQTRIRISNYAIWI